MNSNSTEAKERLQELEKAMAQWLAEFSPAWSRGSRGGWETGRAHVYTADDLRAKGPDGAGEGAPMISSRQGLERLAEMLKEYAALSEEEAEGQQQPGDFIYAMM